MNVRNAFLAVTIAMAAIGAIGAGDAGQVDATLQADGRTLRLDHVLVVAMGNEEGLDPSPRLRIFFSSAEMPLRYATGASTVSARAWAQAANATAIVVYADPTGQNQSGVMSVLGKTGVAGDSVFGSASSSDGLTPFKVTGGRASGVATFEGSAGSLKASFNAPVTQVPTTQDLKDKAAADSAQAKALLAFRAALKKGDMKEAARYATANRMKLVDGLRAESPQIFKAMLGEMIEGAALAKTIKRVVVRGETASIVLSTQEIDEMVREGSDWKVD